MAYKVTFFQNSRGEAPVRMFLEKQDSATQAKFIHLYELLRDYGPRLGWPHVKHIREQLYELRVRGKTEIRIVYTRIHEMYVLLHAFQKKSQKTPARDIKIAIRRLTEI